MGQSYSRTKSNIATIGIGDWSKMIYHFTGNTKEFLEEYFKRNQSESGIAEDKKRTGWKLGQKIPDRINTAKYSHLIVRHLLARLTLNCPTACF